MIAEGQRQGPSSPYYVDTLALQNIACNQLDPIGPPCDASKPTHSKQSHGDSHMPFGSLWKDDLKTLSKYFSLFDNVYIGTIWLDGWDVRNLTSNTAAAQLQAKVAQEFMNMYPDVATGWYITEEVSLTDVGSDASVGPSVVDFLDKTMSALKAVKDLPVLWSPVMNNHFHSYNSSALASLTSNLENIFCELRHPLRLHFQDYLGQSVRFYFPMHWDYSNAYTCEEDSVPWLRLLENVGKKCPNLSEVKINAEMFAERWSDSGEKGENNGANIVNADPREVFERLSCYQRLSAPVGVCWALPHWYSLWTFANATVYSPY